MTPTTPGPGTPATLERLGSLLAALTAALPLLGALTGATDVARRNNPILFDVAMLLLALGIVSLFLLHFWGPQNALRQVIALGALIFLVLSALLFVFTIGSTGATDSRPIITVNQTGTGMVTLSGTASGAGLGADERLGLRIVDDTKELYSAAMGAAPNSGIAEIAFAVQTDGRADRDIEIIAWTFSHAPDAVTCDSASAPDSRKWGLGVLPLVSCLKVHLRAPNPVGPHITLTPVVSKDNRSITVALTGVVGPQEAIVMGMWDGARLIHEMLARPGIDGAVIASTLVPLGDAAADICATADVVAGGMNAPVRPNPCTGLTNTTTYAQVLIPAAPTLVPTAAGSGPPTPAVTPALVLK